LTGRTVVHTVAVQFIDIS